MKGGFVLGLILTHLAIAEARCTHGVQRRNLGGPVIEARQVTDEASAAVSVDPSTECSYYSYAPVTAIKANYPTIWQTATIQPNDQEAMSLFQTINASLVSKFPNDMPHGTNNGNFAGVNYTSADPDCWWTWKGCTTPAASTGLAADITTVPEPLTWGLGFDDGPNCSHNALYDYLMEQNQKATMFYIGSNVMDWPLQALRGIDDGHQICVHTWSHQYMTSFSNEDAFAELYYTQKAIKELLGVTPQCWRPPYGDVDNRIRYIASQLNMSTIVWSDDTEDWKEGVPADNVTQADVTANYQAVINKVSNNTYANHGPVVLNHELTNFTMSEFLQEYPMIKSAFQHIVPICTALNITHPYAETNITCPDFATYLSGTHNVSASTVNTDASSGSSSSSASAASGTSTGSSSSKASGTASASGSSASASKTGAASSTMASPVGLVGGLVTLLMAIAIML